jgi:PAS domain S-box-containing protein
MTELLGYSHDELLNKELWEIGLLQDKEASQRAFLELKKTSYIRYEDLPLENHRGEQRQVEFVSNLYRENGHTVIQCNIRDITDRKRAEAELAAVAVIHGQHSAALAVLEERTRMAQEIHDTLAQGLTGITAQLEAAEAALAKTPATIMPESYEFQQDQWEKVRTRIHKALDLARESLIEARRSVMTLRPHHREAVPLSEALNQFLVRRVVGTSITSHYSLEGPVRMLSAAIQHCLLRIGQEAISNAVEHARPQNISVELCFALGSVRLRVIDDGCGFSPDILPAGRFGIIGMRERAEKIRAVFMILGSPGHGTQVHLRIPLDEDSAARDSTTGESTQ